MKNISIYRLICSLFIWLSASSAIAGFSYSTDARDINNYSRQLITIMKWDIKYEKDREKDVNYLLGHIDGAALDGLTSSEKEQVLSSMRAAVLKQMLSEKDYFKDLLLQQYAQFFTSDELEKLIAYFKTDLMKMVVQSQIDQKQLTVEDINKAIYSSGALDRRSIEWFRDSYLSTRNNRFQKKSSKAINDAIYKRMGEVLEAAMKQLPETIAFIKSRKN